MNIDRKLVSPLARVPRLAAVAALAATLVVLAACGQNQNWSSTPSLVSVGGSVTGLNGTLVLQNNGDTVSVTGSGQPVPFTFPLYIKSGGSFAVSVKTQPQGQTCTLTDNVGSTTSDVTTIAVGCVTTPTISVNVAMLSGTLVLQDNGTDNLTVRANGTFSFATPLAQGAAYSVTVLSQPAGQTCNVAAGSGTANANVTVNVTCQNFMLRPMPAVYTTGKAINYSPYRLGQNPGGTPPTDQNIKDDLNLLQQAGFTLLRTFGSDAVLENVVKLASTNNPTIKFQQGIYLVGPAPGCSNAANDKQVADGIRLANTYSNIVAVSVGNETSFAGNLQISCLVSYIQKVRNQVTQPVTADDDYTFYAGYDNNNANPYAPDTVVQTLDFVSIHLYPFSSLSWDWQQKSVAAGDARAAAMMAAAFATEQNWYQQVYNYSYQTAAGGTATIGATRPITVGETGWKAAPTNLGSPLEAIANPAIAQPVNAKMFYDALGTWTGAGAPLNIFYFEAFDEPWKGADDGWGLWDQTRTPRYALCGTYAGTPACNNPIYAGAGYWH